MARNTNDTRLVEVKIAGFPNLRYVFRTRIKEANSTTLGHVDINAQGVNDVKGIVIGANSPKPPRASKRFDKGYEGSYVDKDKIEDVRKDGWRIKRGKNQRGGKSQFAQLKYITINGIKYAWYSPNSDDAPDLSQTGINDATPKDSDLVFGAEFPKPPRLKKELADGSTYSTFIDPKKYEDLLDQADWSRSGDGNYTAKDLNNYA